MVTSKRDASLFPFAYDVMRGYVYSLALQREVDRPFAIMTTAVNQDLRRDSGDQWCYQAATGCGMILAVLNKVNLPFDVSAV